MHHAVVPELAHAGVHDGVAGLPALPGFECHFVVAPWKGIEGCLQVAGGEIRHVEQQMAAEFAPAEFAQEFVGIASESRTFGGGKLRGMPDLTRADLAKAQMRREGRCAVAVGPIAVFGVALEACLEKILEPLLRRALACRPALAQASRPVRMCRLEAKVVDGLACDALPRMQVARRGQGLPRSTHRL